MSVSFDVSYVGIFGASIAAFLLGMFWYSPVGFGKKWMKLIGMTEKKMKSGNPMMAMGLGFVFTLVMAFVLSNVLSWAGAATLVDGAIVGFWIWVGFYLTSQIGIVLWEMRPVELFALNTAYSLITTVVMAAILTVL